MVEQWSSKSPMWVRILLSLFLVSKENLLQQKIKIINNLTKKHQKTKYKYLLDFNKNLIKQKKVKLTDLFYRFSKKKIKFNNNIYLLKNFNLFYYFFINKRNNLQNINKNFVLFYFNVYNKNRTLFYLNLNNFFFNINGNGSFFFYNELFAQIKSYYFYYLNCTFFFSKNIKFLQSLPDRNVYFNKYRTGVFKDLVFQKKNFDQPRVYFFFSKLKKKKFSSYWLYYWFFKKFSIKSFKSLKKKYSFFLKKPSFLPYTIYSKFLFFHLNLYNFQLFKFKTNIFYFSQFDNINENLTILTKNSLNLNKFDIFKNILIKLNKENLSFNLFFIVNAYIFKSNLVENDYSFFTFSKEQSFNLKFYKNLADIFIKNKNKIKSFTGTSFVDNWPKFKGYKFNFFKLPNNQLNFFFYSSCFEIITFFFLKPLFFKILYLSDNIYFKQSKVNNNFSLIKNYINIFFYSKKNIYNNIIPDGSFIYFFKKKILKIFNYQKFSISSVPFFYSSIIRFIEFCSGRKVYVKFNAFLNNNLTTVEQARCYIWSQKVKNFRKLLGPRLFLNESLQILYLCLKLKDPYLLSNWMVNMFKKISFWKYKTFLRYLKYVLRYFFWVVFKELNVKGVKFQLKGKISVAGNARTRTTSHYIGFTSHATYTNKILYDLSLVRTFTGVLGLKIWIVF